MRQRNWQSQTRLAGKHWQSGGRGGGEILPFFLLQGFSLFLPELYVYNGNMAFSGRIEFTIARLQNPDQLQYLPVFAIPKKTFYLAPAEQRYERRQWPDLTGITAENETIEIKAAEAQISISGVQGDYFLFYTDISNFKRTSEGIYSRFRLDLSVTYIMKGMEALISPSGVYYISYTPYFLNGGDLRTTYTGPCEMICDKGGDEYYPYRQYFPNEISPIINTLTGPDLEWNASREFLDFFPIISAGNQNANEVLFINPKTNENYFYANNPTNNIIFNVSMSSMTILNSVYIPLIGFNYSMSPGGSMANLQINLKNIGGFTANSIQNIRQEV